MDRIIIALSISLLGCAMGDAGFNRRGGADSGGIVITRDGAMTIPESDAGQAECIDGTSQACMTSCGSMGSAGCGGGHYGPCVPPVETCNGADDDCDGQADEDQMDRTCTSACGGGVSRCTAGTWSACMGGTPRVETCDGTDEDCDGAIDDGLTRPCTNACGSGNETCVMGRWTGCTAPAPRPELCDGIDQDCDGVPDNGVTRRCTTACGAGNETCSVGTWGACTAPLPVAETCNMRDDDCDGEVDNGFQARIFDPVSFVELSALQPACSGPSSRIDYCATAAKRWCHDRMGACFTGGGVGVLQAVPGSARIVCFGTLASERTITFAEVSVGASTSISEANCGSRVASSAVNRYCQRMGFGAGVGPTEHGGGGLTLTCLPSEIAETVSLPTSELGVYGCDPVSNPDTLICASGADLACRSRGYVGGYGPVEWNTTDSAIVCFR